MNYNGGLEPTVLAEDVAQMTKNIQAFDKPFDYIAFRGFSGALLAAPLSLYFQKPLVNVRKQGEPSHSGSIFLSGENVGNYIIVDDFISCGITVDAILGACKRNYCRAIFVTTLQYNAKTNWDGIPVIVNAHTVKVS